MLHRPHRPLQAHALAPALLLAALSMVGAKAQDAPARDGERPRAAQTETQRRADRLAALAARAESRRNAGETPPDPGTDPGHQIMRCQGLSPLPFTIQLPLAAVGTVICGNSVEGQRVLAYRQWYCGGMDSLCVLSRWSGGRPSMQQELGESTQFSFRIPVSNGIASVSISPFDLGTAPVVAARPSSSGGAPVSHITLVVPFPPGGTTDALAKLIAEQLSNAWGVSTRLDHKVGNRGRLAAEAAARAASDGSTLLFAGFSHALDAGRLAGAEAFDLLDQLKPVAMLTDAPVLVVVRGNSPITSFRALLDEARTRAVKVGAFAADSGFDVAARLFVSASGSRAERAMFNTSDALLRELAAGNVEVAFINRFAVDRGLSTGQWRALAVSSAVRHPQLPDVPTTVESGLPQLVVEVWTGVFVPKGTPDDVVERLGTELLAVVARPESLAKIATWGMRAAPRRRPEFAAMVAAEVDRWRIFYTGGATGAPPSAEHAASATMPASPSGPIAATVRLSGGELTYGPGGQIRWRAPFTQGDYIAFDGNVGVRLRPKLTLDELIRMLDAGNVRYTRPSANVVRIGETHCYFVNGVLTEIGN